MPIYEYRCAACGFQKEFLQKMSDAPLTDCPECGKAGAFSKMVTAAGFQLKGSGWYVTDFRQGSKPATGAAPGAKSEAKADGKAETGTAATGGESKAAEAPAKKAEPAASSTASGSSTSGST
jgi:putative FmdB family regulatory protein